MKKVLVTLLAFTVTASMICGCGNRVNQSIAAEPDPATVEESTVTVEEEPTPEPQPTAEPDKEAEATPEPQNCR